MRIGFGYDIHPLVLGRPLILGGVRIPHDQGLGGHSDADVLCHAIADALLGAAALGDIGEHFPDTDSKYKNADSLKLLGIAGKTVREAGYGIVNIDSTVVMEFPKLFPFKSTIRKNIATVLGIGEGEVSIKAKTNEKFGSTGRGESVVAFAVVSIRELQ